MQELARGYLHDLCADVHCAAAAEGETVRLEAPDSGNSLPFIDRPPPAHLRH